MRPATRPLTRPEDMVRAGLETSDRVFWLDGGGSRPWSGQKSWVGVLGDDDVSLSFDAARAEVTRHGPDGDRVVGTDIWQVLAEEIARDEGDSSVHWIGFFGYAARTDLPARPWGRGPDAVWMRCADMRIFEHEEALGNGPGPAAAADADAPQWYQEAFAQVQEALHAGDTYEVNLTYREDIAAVDPLAAYLRLRAANPAPYAGFLSHRGTHLLSSSPERYATLTRDRVLETRPIKGTTPRGATAAEDAAMRELLATDPKFRAENLMITDLLRNDLSMVCQPGTVRVPSLMRVESYPTVHQLVTTVRGRLAEDVTPIGALWALFPAGSMTGAPKLRTMEVIDAVEEQPRGVYAGAFGWICADGRADLGVVIRSLIGAPDGSWQWGTGGGITVDSGLDAE